MNYRKRVLTPSTVSAKKAMRARASCRVPPARRNKREIGNTQGQRINNPTSRTDRVGVVLLSSPFVLYTHHPRPALCCASSETILGRPCCVQLRPLDCEPQWLISFVLFPSCSRLHVTPTLVYFVLCNNRCISFVAIERLHVQKCSVGYLLYSVNDGIAS